MNLSLRSGTPLMHNCGVSGDAWAKWLITPLQYSVMIGLAVAYLVTAGQSFQVCNPCHRILEPLIVTCSLHKILGPIMSASYDSKYSCTVSAPYTHQHICEVYRLMHIQPTCTVMQSSAAMALWRCGSNVQMDRLPVLLPGMLHLHLLQAVHNSRCNGHTETTSDADMDNCKHALTGWIILFGGIQLLLSQVKDFHSLW